MKRDLESIRFRREREESWRELERIVGRVEREGLERIPAQELVHLPALHRAALSALSVARSISLDRNLLDYLESLAARSYFSVYGARRRLLETVGSFFGARFPALVRELRWHVLLAAFFMLAGTAVGFALTARSADAYWGFVPESVAQGRTPLSSTEELEEVLHSGSESASDQLAGFAGFLFTHNAQIGILSFALGFAAGLPVFWLLFLNGLILGAMSALYHDRGLGLEWWAWILPHGVTELLAVVLCGAAGLVQAQAIVFPGRLPRRENLARQGRKAGALVLGAIAMFFVAALIEGVFRQRVHGIEARYVVAALSALAWILYFGLAGRRRET